MRGPFMPPEWVVHAVKGTDLCGQVEAELTLTTGALELKTFTEDPCKRSMTCGMFSGELIRSIRVEDVTGVTVAEPGVCEGRPSCCDSGPKVPCRQRAVSALTSLLVYAGVIILVFNSLVYRSPCSSQERHCTYTCTCGWDCSSCVQECVWVRSATAVGLSVCWVVCFALAVWLSPSSSLLAPFTGLRMVYRIVVSFLWTVFCLGCFCCRSQVRLTGPASHELRIRPGPDMHELQALGVATSLAMLVAQLKAQRAAAKAAASGAAKDTAVLKDAAGNITIITASGSGGEVAPYYLSAPGVNEAEEPASAPPSDPAPGPELMPAPAPVPRGAGSRAAVVASMAVQGPAAYLAAVAASSGSLRRQGQGDPFDASRSR